MEMVDFTINQRLQASTLRGENTVDVMTVTDSEWWEDATENHNKHQPVRHKSAALKQAEPL